MTAELLARRLAGEAVNPGNLEMRQPGLST